MRRPESTTNTPAEPDFRRNILNPALDDANLALLEQQVAPFALRDQHSDVIRLLEKIPPAEIAKSSSLSYWLALALLSATRINEGQQTVREMERHHTKPDALTVGRLSVLHAVACIFSGDTQGALDSVRHARSVLPDFALQERFRAWATTEALSIHIGDFDTAKLAADRLVEIRDQLPLDQQWWYRFVVPNRADWLLKTGRMDEARQFLEAQLQTCPRNAEEIIRLRLAVIALEDQDLDCAGELIESITPVDPDSYWYLEAELVRIEYLRARNETEAAVTALYEVIRNRTSRGSKVEVFRPHLTLADIWIDQGQLDLATTWLNLASKSIDEWPRTYGHPIPGMTRSRLAIARGKWEDAEKHLHRLREIGERRKHDGLLVRIYSHLAYVIAHQGRAEDAMAMSKHAMAAIKSGTFSASLIIGNGTTRDFLTRNPFRVARRTQSTAYPQGLLSPREMEILRLLADARSNQEIANILFISRNTVKIHLQSVYRKLGTTNRSEALEVAQWMDLFNDIST